MNTEVTGWSRMNKIQNALTLRNIYLLKLKKPENITPLNGGEKQLLISRRGNLTLGARAPLLKTITYHWHSLPRDDIAAWQQASYKRLLMDMFLHELQPVVTVQKHLMSAALRV